MLKAKINLIDKNLPIPKYQTSGSVGFDIYSRKNITIQPGKIILIPTNLIIQVPKNYFLLIAARSSLPIKKGLVIANGIGVLDQDYCGPNDEILLEVLNITRKNIKVKRGERLAQGILVRIDKAKFNRKKIYCNNRGGCGSTG